MLFAKLKYILSNKACSFGVFFLVLTFISVLANPAAIDNLNGSQTRACNSNPLHTDSFEMSTAANPRQKTARHNECTSVSRRLCTNLTNILFLLKKSCKKCLFLYLLKDDVPSVYLDCLIMTFPNLNKCFKCISVALSFLLLRFIIFFVCVNLQHLPKVLWFSLTHYHQRLHGVFIELYLLDQRV